jgi:integrase
MTRTNGKRWSYLAGEKGRNRVRAYEHPRSGLLYLEVRENGRKVRVALRHRDRDNAKGKADTLAARLCHATVAAPPDPTLGSLITEYLREVTPTKGESKQAHDRRAGRMFTALFGTRKAATLDRRDWDAFIAWRRRGGDTRSGKAHGRPVGPRIITYDLKFLHSVLNWATTVRMPAGPFLLERNPLRGSPWPRVTTVRRPLCTKAQYHALRSIAPAVHPLADLALLLVYETGHRMASVRQLRWDDVDDAEGTVQWRGCADKMGHDHRTPLSDAARTALRERHAASRVSDWVFPSPSDPTVPVSRHLVRSWWRELERRAGLTPEPGRGWHAFRRTFATEFKWLPLRDLMALGGWQSPLTLTMCYTAADPVTQRQALAKRATLTADGLATDTGTDTPARSPENTAPHPRS